MERLELSVEALDAPAAELGESPVWSAAENALYWCDIAGHALCRFEVERGVYRTWPLGEEVSACAPLADGSGLLLAMRDGLFHFSPACGKRALVCAPPYQPAGHRFNDGKVAGDGRRFWVSTLDDARRLGSAALYAWDGHALQCIHRGLTVGNGLAFANDGATLYFADTTSHSVYRLNERDASGPQLLRAFPLRQAAAQKPYGGRPDGAAMDEAGGYWVAMYEGSRVLRLDGQSGAITHELLLPVTCPTMPCFGGADRRTLYITTARKGRPADELARQPLAGRVLAVRLPLAGLPVPAFAPAT